MKSSNLGVTVLQDAATANGDGALLKIANYQHVVVCISGTFSANVYLEASLDGTVWHEVSARDLTSTNSNDKAKTITAPGLFGIELIGGCTVFRARIGSYVSGSVTVRANAHG